MSEVELNEAPAGGYSVTLPTFEGPLDLLLHLCQKHELDILDIPIAFVTEKYLEYLSVLQLMNLDVASEYLVMAATLAHIKSKMLLPAPPPGQEDEIAAEEQDPREALIRRLLEYQKYKHAGAELAGRGVAGRDVFLRGMPTEEAVHTGLPPLAQVPLFSLVEAFQGVLAKSNVKLSHDIVHERVTLADRINELVDILRARRRVTFEELFVDLETRFDLVITFLALLEMTRLRMTRLFQADFDSDIYIEFTAQVTADTEDGSAEAADALDRESAEATDALDRESADAADADAVDREGAEAADADALDFESADAADADAVDHESTETADADALDFESADAADADAVDHESAETADADADADADAAWRARDDDAEAPSTPDADDARDADATNDRDADATSDALDATAEPTPPNAEGPAEKDAGGVSEDAEDDNT